MEHCHWNTEPLSCRRGHPDSACQPPGPNVCSSLSKTQPATSSSSQHYSGGKVTCGLRRNRLSGTWGEGVRRREKTCQASGDPEESFQAIHKPWSQPGCPREGRVCNPGSGKPLTRVTPAIRTPASAKWTDLVTTASSLTSPTRGRARQQHPPNFSCLPCQAPASSPSFPAAHLWRPSPRTQWKISFPFMTVLKIHMLHSSPLNRHRQSG